MSHVRKWTFAVMGFYPETRPFKFLVTRVRGAGFLGVSGPPCWYCGTGLG